MRIDLPFRFRRSAGVAVTPYVHRLIRSANALRDARDWAAAALAYRQAVDRDPGLFHVWVQLGHALKEAGQPAEARHAYSHAAMVAPHAAEAHLHLGHVAKKAGDHVGAGRHYLDAFHAEPSNADALTELHQMLTRNTTIDRDRLVEVLAAGLAEDDPPPDVPLNDMCTDARRSLERVVARLDETAGADAPDPDAIRRTIDVLARLERQGIDQSSNAAGQDHAGDEAATLVFDISDLISYFRAARLPTGIQRVQIEVISHALLSAARRPRICCFVEGRDEWLEVPVEHFRALARLSVARGDRDDPVWLTALTRLQLQLAIAQPFAFPSGAYLLNLGTSWWLQNYFLLVRDAKKRFGIRYIPFVHDMIPIMTPQHCVRQLTQDFISWTTGVFAHADHFLVNSESTRRDLIAVSGILGATMGLDNVSVIRLDADFRTASGPPRNADALTRWGIGTKPFVLFVSTIESRKNHVGAFDAWAELIRRHGVREVPRLVCVGGKGWLNDAVYQRLESNAELASRVIMLSHLSDDDLKLLYERCQFTLYPSLYEGWGLPVTESLCYGKVPVLADSSSLPEAAGEFGVYFEAGSVKALAAAVERVSFDPSHRAALEARIAAEFRPRSWADIGDQIGTEVRRLAARTGGVAVTVAPLAVPGLFYPLARNTEISIWPGLGSGEIFRSGVGWLWPEEWGCWTAAQGGGLEIGLAEPHKGIRLYLRLRGPMAAASDFAVDRRGGTGIRGSIEADEAKWVALDLPASARAETIELRLRAQPGRTAVVTNPAQSGIGLFGFILLKAGDAAHRANFLEAAMLGNLETLNAYRAPASLAAEPVDPW